MLLEPCTKGDPETPLHYTSTGIRNREKVLGEQGFCISDTASAQILKEQRYSLQANRKEQARAKSHPDRNV
jgi:hypothetical protein